jgi:hypothetical protein
MPSGYESDRQGSNIDALLDELDTFINGTIGTLDQLCFNKLTVDEQSGAVIIDMDRGFQEITLTTALNLETLDRAAGCVVVLRINNDASDPVDITYPPEWKWDTAEPVTIPVDKYALLTLRCFGVLDEDIHASFSIQAFDHLSALKETFDWANDTFKIHNADTGNFEYATLDQLFKNLVTLNDNGNLVLKSPGSSRIILDVDTGTLAIVGGTSKTNAAFFEVFGDSSSSAGHAGFRIKGTGAFRIRWADFGTLSPAPLYFEVDADGFCSALSFKILPVTLDEASGAMTVDFNAGGNRKLVLTADANFETLNREAGKAVTILIRNDSTTAINVTFPLWEFIPSVPATIEPFKWAYLHLYCDGPDDADVIASYSVQD